MRFQNGQLVNRLQGRSAEVIDIGTFRARMSAEERARIASRFRAKGVHGLALEFKRSHKEIEDVIREQMTWLPRAA